MCTEGCTGITATGIDVTSSNMVDGYQIVAVDPAVIPLGSKLIIHTKQGSFKAIALDTGGGIDGYELDVLVMTEQEARTFGVQEVTVELSI